MQCFLDTKTVTSTESWCLTALQWDRFQSPTPVADTFCFRNESAICSFSRYGVYVIPGPHNYISYSFTHWHSRLFNYLNISLFIRIYCVWLFFTYPDSFLFICLGLYLPSYFYSFVCLCICLSIRDIIILEILSDPQIYLFLLTSSLSV